MATQTQTKRRATAKKGAATRQRSTARRSASSTRSNARRTTKSAASTATQRAKAEATGLQAVALQAERAVLVPVGAALTARDSIVENVKPYTSRETAQREISRLQRRVEVNLRKFERRGTTARNQLERDLKRNRTKVERFVRRNRRQVESQAENLVSNVSNLV
ncbi:MAG TPA: hypothetical protein VF752_15605 [Thermoleophilaceae bacterium]